MAFDSNNYEIINSLNCRFSYQVMKDIFFNDMVDVYKIHGNKSETRKLVLTAFLMIQRFFRISIPDEYVDMPIHFIGAPDALGVVLEVPNTRRDGECSFIGMVQAKEGKKFYYTNEYSAELNRFVLCLLTENGHTTLRLPSQTLDEFIAAII